LISRWIHNVDAVREWATQGSPSQVPIKWWQTELQPHPRHVNGATGIIGLHRATRCLDNDFFSAVTAEIGYKSARTICPIRQYDQLANKASYRLAHSSRSWPWIVTSLAAEAIVLLGLSLASLTVVYGPWSYKKFDVLPLSYLIYGILSSMSWYITACPWGRRRLGKTPTRILNFVSLAWLAFTCAIVLEVSLLRASHEFLILQDAHANTDPPSLLRCVSCAITDADSSQPTVCVGVVTRITWTF